MRTPIVPNTLANFVPSGNTARLISKYRPVCPIIMVTRNARASRYSHLYRGVYPFLFPEPKPETFKNVPW